MIRFSAGEEEIDLLLRFLRRRAPNAHLWYAFLLDDGTRKRDRVPRRTARPLLARLVAEDGPTRWGLYTADDEISGTVYGVESACVFLLDLGPASGPNRHRNALLEARDEFAGDPLELTRRALVARDLTERAARRLRRRGIPENGRWSLPF